MFVIGVERSGSRPRRRGPAPGPSATAWATGVAAFLAVFALASRADANCSDWSYWSYEEIPRLIAADAPDSVWATLDDWETACGRLEVIERTRLLVALWDGSFDPDHLPVDMVDLLLWRQIRRTSRPAPAAGEPPRPHDRYDDFTMDFARTLLPYLTPGSVGDLLARFYAGDEAGSWRRLQTPAYEGTWLRTLHDRERDRLLRSRARPFFALHGGFLDGSDGLGEVAEQVLLGARVGLVEHRIAAALVLELRAGNSDEEYVVRDGDVLYGSTDFTGLALFVQPSLRLLRASRFELALGGHVGWTGVEALPAEPENDLPALWIHALPRAVGIDLRWWSDPSLGRFVELQLRREWADFDAGSMASELDGGSWQLRLAFGLVHDPDRQARRLLGIGRDLP